VTSLSCSNPALLSRTIPLPFSSAVYRIVLVYYVGAHVWVGLNFLDSAVAFFFPFHSLLFASYLIFILFAAALCFYRCPIAALLVDAILVLFALACGALCFPPPHHLSGSDQLVHFTTM
jgi:hypothetical protein